MVLTFAVCGLPLCAGAQWHEWRGADGTLHVTNEFPSPAREPAQEGLPQAGEPAEEGLPQAGEPSEEGLPQMGGSVAPAAPIVDPTSDPPTAVGEDDVREQNLQQRLARLSARRAHLELLRRSGSVLTAEQRELENLLADEVLAETAAIAALRQPAMEAAP